MNSYNYRYMYFPGDSKRYPEKTFYQSEASVAAMGPNFYEMDRDKVIWSCLLGRHRLPGREHGMASQGMEPGCVRPFSSAQAGCLFREEHVY